MLSRVSRGGGDIGERRLGTARKKTGNRARVHARGTCQHARRSHRHRIFDKERVSLNSFCAAGSGLDSARVDRFIGIQAESLSSSPVRVSARLDPRHLLIHWNTTDAEHVQARVATTLGTRRRRRRRHTVAESRVGELADRLASPL